MNGAQWVVHALRAQGVNTVFGYPGGAIMPVYDALYDGGVEHLLCRHEQGAAMAAIGYARATGKTGVCIATSGPGATNLITGLADALLDSIPVVAITGQVSAPFIGTDAFQEVDVLGLSLACTKHSFLVQSLEELPRIMAEAFDVASSGRPGPVLVDIPKDIQLASGDLEPWFTTVENEVNFPHAEVEQARQMLAKAQKPMLYVGGGVGMAQAVPALREFLAATKMPVTCTLKGLGAVEADYPYYLGMLGMHGTKAANFAVQECDLLIAVGVRFSDRVLGNAKKFAKQAKILQFDVDAAEINKNIRVDAAVIGDLKEILKRINAELPQLGHEAWIAHILDYKVKYPLTYQEPGLTGPYLVEEIYRQTDGDAIIVTEVGQHQMWAAQYYKYKNPRTFLSSGGLGTMGYGLGAAIGAQVANPGKQVINIAGDGCFRMNMNEIATAVRQKLPLIEVIVNNHVLGMVRQWQDLFYEKRYSATVLDDGVDYVKLAEAMGATGYRATTRETFNEALKAALAAKTPVVIDCVIGCDDKVWPMVAPGADISTAFTGEDLAAAQS